MRIKPTLALLALIILLFNSCKKEPSSKPDVPAQKAALEALPAVVYQDGGVTLRGMINKVPTNLKEYGFVIAYDSLLKTSISLLKHEKAATEGEFKQDLFSVEKDKKYYFAIYSIGDSAGLTFSNVRSFIANGARQIKIDSIFPTKAHLGDTITLHGRYLSNRYLLVKFGSSAMAPFTAVNDSVGTFIVPELSEPAPRLVIEYDNRKDTVSTNFSLHTPVITEFTSNLTFRDTVTILGDHFDRIASRNEVRFGNTKAQVVHAGRKMLKVVVPDLIESAFTTINVKAQAQEASTIEKFNLRKPELTLVPAEGGVGDQVIIRGQYFHPLAQKNSVLFENNQAAVGTGNAAQLEVTIPAGPYARRVARVTLKVLEHEVTWQQDLKISDKWVMVNNGIPFNDYLPVGAVSVNNTAYVVSNPKEFTNSKKYLWKFNQSNYSWQRLDLPFDFQQGVMTTSGGKIYLYTASETDNLWEYDPEKNTWTPRADFTFGKRLQPAFFSIGSDLYLGLGAKWVSIFEETADFTFYKYDTKTDRWTRIADYPSSFGDGIRREPATFVLENEAYVGCGATNTGMTSFYRYNPGSNAWSRIADFPDARKFTSAFAANGNGYVVHGSPVGGSAQTSCIKYNRSTNTWVELDPIRDYPGIERSFAFVLNGRVYSGAGNGSDSKNELYEAEVSGL